MYRKTDSTTLICYHSGEFQHIFLDYLEVTQYQFSQDIEEISSTINKIDLMEIIYIKR